MLEFSVHGLPGELLGAQGISSGKLSWLIPAQADTVTMNCSRGGPPVGRAT